jgi:CRP-like cAMP-binding protein
MALPRGIDVGALQRGITLEPARGGSWSRPSTADWARVLAGLPLFANVGKRQLRRIAEIAQVIECTPGDTLVQAGSPGDAFFLILSGSATVVGQPRARRLRTGDFFGEMALLDGEPRAATIRAASELQAMKLPRRSFLRLLEQEPKLAVALLTELASRLRRAQSRR